MQKFFKDNDVKIYHTSSHLKAVVIERFNRSLRELMMKEFVKNNNTVWYNILPKKRDLYDKPSSNIKWSEKLFKIHSINKSNVITYKIKDLNDDIIKGIFYERELQKTKNTSEVYIIEKIIRKNKNKYLVKWRNYSNDFNSWIDKDDIIKYT